MCVYVHILCIIRKKGHAHTRMIKYFITNINSDPVSDSLDNLYQRHWKVYNKPPTDTFNRENTINIIVGNYSTYLVLSLTLWTSLQLSNTDDSCLIIQSVNDMKKKSWVKSVRLKPNWKQTQRCSIYPHSRLVALLIVSKSRDIKEQNEIKSDAILRVGQWSQCKQ